MDRWSFPCLACVISAVANAVSSGRLEADRFVLDSIGDGVDVISDFGAGDVLAIGNMLIAFEAGQEAAFVELVAEGTSTTVWVDVDGAADGAGVARSVTPAERPRVRISRSAAIALTPQRGRHHNGSTGRPDPGGGQ
jgi:hypothetical protein